MAGLLLPKETGHSMRDKSNVENIGVEPPTSPPMRKDPSRASLGKDDLVPNLIALMWRISESNR